MAVLDARVGLGNAMGVPEKPPIYYIKGKLDMSVKNLAAGVPVKIADIPAHHHILSVSMHVTTADSVAAGTADVGLYKQSDDTAIDADGLVNELAIGVDETKVDQAPAHTDGAHPQVDAYIALAQGAGGAGALNDNAVVEFCFLVADMTHTAAQLIAAA
jgi:hypothetical protein